MLPLSASKPILSTALFLLAVAPVSSTLCPVSEEIAAVGSPYELVDGKISVVGFEASVKYATLPEGKSVLLQIKICSSSIAKTFCLLVYSILLQVRRLL